VAERPIALPPERLEELVACFPIKVHDLRLASAFAKRAAMAPTKEKDYASGAAAAYDAQEVDLLTNTRKIIAASKRALRDAEAVLKRR
jgi:hypothetical protein